MKKIKFEGKLNLNKETVTRLDNHQMNNINGGISGGACVNTYTCPPPPIETYQATEECYSLANGTRCLDTYNCL